MKEYWINIWKVKNLVPYTGLEYPTREAAIINTIGAPAGIKCIYRIHVKMKDNYPYPKNSGFYRQKLTRPKRWMT